MKGVAFIIGTSGGFAHYLFEQIRLWLNQEIIPWITYNTRPLPQLILTSPP